ncbi:MAG TPA: SAM-dependent methyltransferase [Terriglobia bacterium]|nr:SAM-dependent methyltransferase [Terriglobia bacterium]
MTTPLKTLLLDTLRRSGPITFAHYMALCLYHPECGYYMQGRERTGLRGDYFTSSDLHPIFARLIARQAAEMWEILDRPTCFTWVEMGAGRGLFAQDFLDRVRRARPEFGRALEYIAVEPGPQQRARLAERLNRETPAGRPTSPPRVRIVADLEEFEPVTGCFFSNELADAFPVSVVTRSGGRLKEVYVEAEGEDLREKFGPISDSRVAAAVARYAHELEEGQRVEVSLQAVDWLRGVVKKLARGFVVAIDYGDLADRLYTVDRPRGTLLAYQGHMSSENFFAGPGEQDLTAHVNFSALIDEGNKVGLKLTGFTTQERFLMALGEANEFRDLYDEGQTETEKLRARLKLKRLLDPASMGSIFKVLIQHQGIDRPELTGLKYSRR